MASGANPASAYVTGGSYRPVGSLETFHGENYGGEWQLTVADNAGADVGMLVEWCVLTLCDVRPPGPSSNLIFTNSTTLVWEAAVGPGGLAPTHDLLRSGDATDFDPVSCVVSDSAATEAVDAVLPVAGEAFFYLIRSQNPCPGGLGTLGIGSNGQPRGGPTCP